MHEYEEHIICDKCGKTIDLKDDRISLWGKNHKSLRLFKIFKDSDIDMIDYDFCKDCAKKVEKAIKNVMKED